MTREEAIRKLQKQKAEYLEKWVDFSGVAEAYDMAIEALEQPEPCKDAVSRQAAIDEVKKHYRAYDNDLLEVIAYKLEELPPAQPEQQWIPCSERLPEGDANVLVNVCVPNAPWKIILMPAQSVKDQYQRKHVNAWMPLPEPYTTMGRNDEDGDNMTQDSASQALINAFQDFMLDYSQVERIVDLINEVPNNYAIDTAGKRGEQG